MQPTDAEIAARLKTILQSDEFRPSLSERFWDWLRPFFHWIGLWAGPWSTVFVVVTILILAYIAFRILKTYLESAGPVRHRKSTGPRNQSSLQSPETLIAQARSLAEAGLLRDAARALQQALLVFTCRERNVPWRPSLSDWEWVAILGAGDRVVDFTRSTQRLAFGPQPSRALFDDCAREIDTLIARRARQESEPS